ncbi:hypothetical protein [Bosea minatitlanensis]|uniref:Uncharacterized protein n=1 Tax=Bosea minatitlanensis TaxID=128782 RepID=A0ABW0F032_9HYPH|nr:hypothetical protein [Bosea minatitlanensis]MCT4491765.1 hypothetical protein [Bosea minatitlanensis]
MKRSLPPAILKLRLDVVLSCIVSQEAAQAAVLAWASVEGHADKDDFERLLIEAILQVLPEDQRLLTVVTLAHAFVDRLAEARDGLL